MTSSHVSQLSQQLGPFNLNDEDYQESDESTLFDAKLTLITKFVAEVEDENGLPGAYTGQWAVSNQALGASCSNFNEKGGFDLTIT